MSDQANCTERGRDTPPKVHLCVPCVNDPDYADYRTEWEIWELAQYRKDMAGMEEESRLEEALDWYTQTEELYHQSMFDPIVGAP